MDKHELMRALCAAIEGDLARAIEAAERTRRDAIHEEARPENDKDTRALEQSYLARGQAQRVVELTELHARVKFMPVRAFGPDDAIDLSALVRVDDEESDESRWYFLVPAGGGRRVEQAGIGVDVITPEAPLGRALIGRSVGDDLQLRIGTRVRELVIGEVR